MERGIRKSRLCHLACVCDHNILRFLCVIESFWSLYLCHPVTSQVQIPDRDGTVLTGCQVLRYQLAGFECHCPIRSLDILGGIDIEDSAFLPAVSILEYHAVTLGCCSCQCFSFLVNGQVP